MAYELVLTGPLPYFAEFPYAVWGEVNYDSDGDCQRPTDQQWTELFFERRDTGEGFQIVGHGDRFMVDSDTPELAARAAWFLADRTAANVIGDDPRGAVGAWTLEAAYAATERIRAEFPRPELAPFDSRLFWGSWKWVGGYATEYTWVGRWIMNALLTRDTRAVNLCIHWLREGTAYPEQTAALCAALELLTGQSLPSGDDWVAWYDREGQALYPIPDFNAWFNDLSGASS